MSNKTRQDKLSSFLDPKPIKKLEDSKHGQAGSFLDDTGDIYDHTKTFFKKESTVESFADDIGPKRIKGNISNIDLDQKIYGSKKSSRNQRDTMKQDLKHNNYDSSELDDEEEEDDDEEGEDGIMESGEASENLDEDKS
jgi:hypothetical protein